MKWRKKSIFKSNQSDNKRQYLESDSTEFAQIWHRRSLAGLEKKIWSSSWPEMFEGRSWDFGQGGGNGFWWIWTTFLKRLKSTLTIRILTNGQRHHLEGYLNYLFNTNFWGFGFYPPSSMQKMADFFFHFLMLLYRPKYWFFWNSDQSLVMRNLILHLFGLLIFFRFRPPNAFFGKFSKSLFRKSCFFYIFLFFSPPKYFFRAMAICTS